MNDTTCVDGFAVAQELHGADTVASNLRQQAVRERAFSAGSLGDEPTYVEIVPKQIIEHSGDLRTSISDFLERQGERCREAMLPIEPAAVILKCHSPVRRFLKPTALPIVDQHIQRTVGLIGGACQNISPRRASTAPPCLPAERGAARRSARCVRLAEAPLQHHTLASQLVEMIRPPLRHADTLIPMGATMIGSADRIAIAMGQGALDCIRMP